MTETPSIPNFRRCYALVLGCFLKLCSSIYLPSSLASTHFTAHRYFHQQRNSLAAPILKIVASGLSKQRKQWNKAMLNWSRCMKCTLQTAAKSEGLGSESLGKDERCRKEKNVSMETSEGVRDDKNIISKNRKHKTTETKPEKQMKYEMRTKSHISCSGNLFPKNMLHVFHKEEQKYQCMNPLC